MPEKLRQPGLNNFQSPSTLVQRFGYPACQLQKDRMLRVFSVMALAAFASLFFSCKKQDQKDACFPGVATVRKITDKPAVVKVIATANTVYIVEQGTIDTKLIPCNLPKEFAQNDLAVIVSGDVKATPQTSGPCCSENFVISEIKR